MDALKIENPWTPAHQAVELSDHATLTRILDEGADADEVCSQMTLLMHAIDREVDVANQSGEPIDSALTAILLAYGADPHLVVNATAPTMQPHAHVRVKSSPSLWPRRTAWSGAV
ncbi:hypothetical protein [Streptomyces sp. Qhu_M48]|uniref:hypothetical protein n=1 Tax=Streptomyces sp. Qhu_M48 TaxID=3435889 RepID=UPI003F4F4BA3